MGTRAVYVFHDGVKSNDRCFVYKHYDNYPQGAVGFIEAAKGYAWEFPRFEADEFAAAFVAANKNPKGGEVRIMSVRQFETDADLKQMYTFCQYWYEITFDQEKGDLIVTTSRVRDDGTGWKTLASMPLEDMKRRYKIV